LRDPDTRWYPATPAASRSLHFKNALEFAIHRPFCLQYMQGKSAYGCNLLALLASQDLG